MQNSLGARWLRAPHGSGTTVALQVGWEGPSECTFCPTLGVLRLRGLSAHFRGPVPQLRSKCHASPRHSMVIKHPAVST